MAYRVVFSPLARAQLVSIFDYLEIEASLTIAERFTNRIIAFCEKLDTFPNRGSPRDDLTLGLRVITYRRTVTVAYFVDDQTVSVASIFYGGRDFESAFGDDNEPNS